MNQFDNAVEKAERRLKGMSPRDFYTGGNASTCVNEVTIKTAIWMSLPEEIIEDNQRVFSEIRSHDSDSEARQGRRITDLLFIGRGKSMVMAIELKYVSPRFLIDVMNYIKDQRFENTRSPLTWMSIPADERNEPHPLYDEDVPVALHEWTAKKVMKNFHRMQLRWDTPYQKTSIYNKRTRKIDVTNSTLGDLCEDAERQVADFATLTEGVTHTRVIVFVGDVKFYDVTDTL